MRLAECLSRSVIVRLFDLLSGWRAPRIPARLLSCISKSARPMAGGARPVSAAISDGIDAAAAPRGATAARKRAQMRLRTSHRRCCGGGRAQFLAGHSYQSMGSIHIHPGGRVANPHDGPAHGRGGDNPTAVRRMPGSLQLRLPKSVDGRGKPAEHGGIPGGTMQQYREV